MMSHVSPVCIRNLVFMQDLACVQSSMLHSFFEHFIVHCVSST